MGDPLLDNNMLYEFRDEQQIGDWLIVVQYLFVQHRLFQDWVLASFGVDGTSPVLSERFTIIVKVGNRLSLTALNTLARIVSRGHDLTGAVENILATSDDSTCTNSVKNVLAGG